MPMDLTDGKSTLVQVMAWCRQATITWANVDQDLCHHMASLGDHELSIGAIKKETMKVKLEGTFFTIIYIDRF